MTSTASTCTPGLAAAIPTAIGPNPHPRSRIRPCSGGATVRNSTEVPRSSRVPENTPFAVVKTNSRPNTVAVISRVTMGEESLVK